MHGCLLKLSCAYGQNREARVAKTASSVGLSTVSIW